LPLPEASPFYTDNPRERRIIRALAAGPRTREQLDAIAGASNGPSAIAALRRRGLEIPSNRLPAVDRDGETVFRGRYEFSERDLLRTREIWEGDAHGDQ
jgi:hypothetical protein